MSALSSGGRVAASPSTTALLVAKWPLVGSTLCVHVSCLEFDDATGTGEVCLRIEHNTNAGVSTRIPVLRWSVERAADWQESRLLGCEIDGQSVRMELLEYNTSAGAQRVLLTNLPSILGLLGGTYGQPVVHSAASGQ